MALNLWMDNPYNVDTPLNLALKLSFYLFLLSIFDRNSDLRI